MFSYGDKSLFPLTRAFVLLVGTFLFVYLDRSCVDQDQQPSNGCISIRGRQGAWNSNSRNRDASVSCTSAPDPIIQMYLNHGNSPFFFWKVILM